MTTSDKTMFEIYREKEYNRQYKVVYFTELGEHNKESEINRALIGEHFLDGFILDKSKDAAKDEITNILHALNAGEPLSVDDVQKRLMNFLG